MTKKMINNFIKINSHLIYNKKATFSENYVSLHQSKLIILSGLTGVGKTTLIDHILSLSDQFHLLPNRRDLTDQIIIPIVSGNQTISDRKKRFEITRQFREAHPGGMGEILNQLQVDKQLDNKIFIFDNLRGINEIEYCHQHFPNSYYIFLNATNETRLSRLLFRQDQFDHIQTSSVELLPEYFQKYFSLDFLSNLIASQEYDLTEIIKKGEIIISEEKNYQVQPVMDYIAKNQINSLTIETDHLTLEEKGQIIEDKIKENFVFL
ncbi:MAG: AAA family ATPase [Spirochaetes bacterium]|nr:AAA family ATPase [Spirochaetota bacterium]